MANDPFIKDFKPTVGMAEPIAKNLRRIVAPNASPMTFTGTNTYVLGDSALAIIDPGPQDKDHFRAILNAVGPDQHISHIFVTHSHVDHSPLAKHLSHQTDAPVLAYGDSFTHRSPQMATLAAQNEIGGGEGVDKDFEPDVTLKNGETVTGAGWSLSAIYTPGHFSNHLCFAWPQGRAAFTGDHIMSWATTMVSPPDGDLTAFMASLDVMSVRPQDQIYYPGHGAPVHDPQAMVSYLRDHRNQRESQILTQIAAQDLSVMTITQAIYTDIPPALIPAAARNVLAHLLDLIAKNKVVASGPITPDTTFSR